MTPSHRLCGEVLRDRRFGVSDTPYQPDEHTHLGHEDGTEWELSFLFLDPPDHTRLRSLARPAFSPRMIRGYRERIERATERLLQTAAAQTQFDLIRDFAAPLPIAVITELLGIPDTDVERFTQYGRVVGAALDGVRTPMEARRLRRTTRDLNELFADLVRKRAAAPGDDIISTLAQSLPTEELTARELLGICRLLLIAGFETTVNLIGNGMLALLSHPEQWAKLCEEPGLAENAVEEVLRYDPPVQLTGRLAQQDVEIEGESIPQGGYVVTLLGAAGRDPSAYAEPDRFDITRNNGPEHLAFSGGRHYCLGAPLARLEGAIAFRALAERLPHLKLGEWVRRRRTLTIRGLREFPVRLPHQNTTTAVSSRSPGSATA